MDNVSRSPTLLSSKSLSTIFRIIETTNELNELNCLFAKDTYMRYINDQCMHQLQETYKNNYNIVVDVSHQNKTNKTNYFKINKNQTNKLCECMYDVCMRC